MKLSHFTDASNSELIGTEGLRKSKHIIPTSIMWLGDGVYFYRTGCDFGKQEAISLVSNKIGFKSGISEFQYSMNIDESEVLSLNNPEHAKKIIEIFTVLSASMAKLSGKGNTYLERTLNDLGLAFENIAHWLPFSSDNFGKVLGSVINMISSKEAIEFTLVECSFNSVPNRAYSEKYSDSVMLLNDGRDLSKTAIYQCCIKTDSNIMNHTKEILVCP